MKTNKDNSWIQTYTGKQFFPLNPKTEDVCIEDIAWALSNICRFNGHSTHFYSVAEHSVYVSENVPVRHALQGLLHDAAEAYIGDIPTPIKPFFNVNLIERQLMRCISLHFLLEEYPFPDIIKKVDAALLATETKQIMSPAPAPWPQLKEQALDVEIKCYSSVQAFRLFINRYKEIKRDKK